MIELTLGLELWADASDDTEALLDQWHVAEGAAVRAGQLLATAVIVKTTVELVAPADGTIEAILVPAGETFARGAPLARLRESGAPAEAPAPSAEADPAASPAAGAPAAPPEAPAPARRRIPFTGMRGSIARNLTAAWQAPRVAVGLELDLTATMARLEALRAGAERPRPTLTAMVVRAAALALRAHPGVNALVGEDGVELADGVHIAVAVSLDDGLVTPVIRDADQKSVQAIAGEIASLAGAARSGGLPPGALQGGTFTVSSLGATGIDWFTPVLNPPQAAILGVGRVAERPVVRAGSLAVAPCATLTLVFDHRALDGEPAARFLADLGRLLAEASDL